MLSPDQLLAVRNSLLTTAGLSATHNDTPEGMWQDIAAACEDIAATSNPAFANVQSAMTRSALAINALTSAITSTYNQNYEGLLQAFVEALEEGTPGAGALSNRLVLAAAGFTGGTPVPAEVTFGALTIAGHGGVAVTGASISSGDPSGHWTITSGFLVPSAAGDTANLSGGPYSLVFNDGSTLTVNIAANEWDVRQTSEWNTVIVQSAATLSGKKIAIRPGETIVTGVDGVVARLRRNDYGGLEIYCREVGQYATFDKMRLRGTRNVTLRRLKSTAVAEQKILITGEAANNASGLTIDQCWLSGVVADANGNYTTSTNYPNFGIDMLTTGGSAINSVGSLTITNNIIEWCGSGINIKVSNGASATSTITGNLVRYFYDDGIAVSGAGNATGETGYDCVSTVRDNVVYGTIGLSTDSANPHTDAYRFIATNLMTTDWTIYFDRNLFFPGNARGGYATQGLLASDFKQSGVDSGFFFKGTAIGNVIVTRDSTWGIAVENAKDFVALNNTVIKAGGGGSSPQVNIAVGAGSSNATTSGTHRLERNIADAYQTGGSPTLTDNVTSGLGGATLAYSGTFDGPTFDPATRAELLTQLSRKAGGPADLGGTYDAGAIGSGAVVFPSASPGSGGTNNVS